MKLPCENCIHPNKAQYLCVCKIHLCQSQKNMEEAYVLMFQRMSLARLMYCGALL